MSTNKRKLKKVESVAINTDYHKASVEAFSATLNEIESRLRLNSSVTEVKVHMGEWPDPRFAVVSYRRETKKEHKKRVNKCNKRKMLKLKNERHVCKIELKRQTCLMAKLNKKIKKL